MNSAILSSGSLNPSSSVPSVGDALHDLGLAAKRVARAVWVAAFVRPAPVPRVLTPFEEAEQLRAFADSWLQTDRGFAMDLYAAADRHELAARG